MIYDSDEKGSALIASFRPGLQKKKHSPPLNRQEVLHEHLQSRH